MLSMKEDYVHINRLQNETLKTAQSEEITFACYFWRLFAAFKRMLHLLKKTKPCKRTYTYSPRQPLFEFHLEFP